MAGEWIAYDLALPAKPEVQELLDLTGEPLEVVVFRLLQLWGWASLNCEQGVAKMTAPRLARVCGGDVAFWRAVEAVGWLEFDETAATVSVPGWDRRFSQAAKSRAQHAERAKAFEERRACRRSGAGPPGAQAPDDPALKRRRGEERREEIPPPPREASLADWETLRAAWNAGPGRPWKPVEAPSVAQERLLESGWLPTALEAIGLLGACRYFTTPVTLPQFCGRGFAMRVVGGQYDTPKAPKAGPPADPPKRQLSEDFTQAVKATRAAIEARRKEAC